MFLAPVPTLKRLATTLRHRLCDVHSVVNRTLVHALLTDALTANYLGSVVILQTIVRLLSGQES